MEEGRGQREERKQGGIAGEGRGKTRDKERGNEGGRTKGRREIIRGRE